MNYNRTATELNRLEGLAQQLENDPYALRDYIRKHEEMLAKYEESTASDFQATKGSSEIVKSNRKRMGL